jgi:acylphosphatase
MAEQELVARHLTVHGHVQGVFFRDSTRRRAATAGLDGWVRNRPDGTVEAWLEGPVSAVAAVEHWIRDGGPPGARVTHVHGEDRAPVGMEGFVIRP